jgi:feruloyl-CoA synthase
MVLSGNSIDFGLLILDAMQVGIPVVPVSPAYSLMSQDHAKVKHIFELCAPGLIYAAQGGIFGPVLSSLDLDGAEVVIGDAPTDGMTTTPFSDLLSAEPTDAVEATFAEVGPDSICKILFTSGSTGLPKGVLNTQRMLCSNQQALITVWPFMAEDPPVLVDWLPWNHTFGGNNNFNLVMRNGGTLYIDAGKPAPELFDQSIANLRDVSTNIYYNVPAGFNMLLAALEADDELRDKFFAKLKVIMYAAAALPPDLWRRLEVLSEKSRGKRVLLTSAWGSTETAPMATIAHFVLESAGNIGVPGPGISIKMVPTGDKMELRVKGPNVTPGYLKRDDLTEAAFDDEGYYCIGDAGRLIDPGDANKGIAFDGRVAENFKLLTATWVTVGALRVAVLAAASPVLQDAVITGHDREYVGLLAWPNMAACCAIAGLPEDTQPKKYRRRRQSA